MLINTCTYTLVHKEHDSYDVSHIQNFDIQYNINWYQVAQNQHLLQLVILSIPWAVIG